MLKTIIVKGEIKTKQRPRVTVKNGFAKAYTPKETVLYENRIRAEFERQCGGFTFKNKPLIVIISCHFQTNKEMMKYDLQQIACVNHKDLDNIAKEIDALNKIAFDDDCQITNFILSKCYDEQEYMAITISDELISKPFEVVKKEYKLAELKNKLKQLLKSNTKDEKEKATKLVNKIAELEKLIAQG